jgi:hypothetical protein
MADNDSTVLLNPERGAYMYTSSTDGLLNPTNFSSETDVGKAAPYNARLIFARTTLPTGAALSGGQLTDIATSLTTARTKGVKVIIRFAYTFTSSTSDATLARIQEHAAQLKPVLEANKDVIFLVQSGFIGAFGEWADSANFNFSATGTGGLGGRAGRRAVLDAVLAMTPKGIPIANTCMYCLMDYFPTVVGSTNAFDGSDKSRVGFQNDCFMASANDQFQYPNAGTIAEYPDTPNTASPAQKRAYAIAQGEYSPHGGETCAGTQQRLGCTSTIADNGGNTANGIMNEGPRYRLSYLGRLYYQAFWDSWTSGGCFNNVVNMMGYRFHLKSLSHADAVNRGATIVYSLSIRNVGWSRIFSARRARMVMTNGASSITCFSNQYLRQLSSQATRDTLFKFSCSIPAGATTGSWAVHVDFPDMYTTTQANDFKIRPANSNNGGQTWDATNYRFTTGTTVTVN